MWTIAARTVVVAAAAAAISACFTGLPPGTGPVDTTEANGEPFLECEAGDEIPCTCINGASGVQICLDTGAELGPCRCGPQPDPMAASTTLPPAGDSGGDTGDLDDSEGSAGSGSDSTGGGTAASSSSGGTTG